MSDSIGMILILIEFTFLHLVCMMGFCYESNCGHLLKLN